MPQKQQALLLVVKQAVIELLCNVKTITDVDHRLPITSTRGTFVTIGIVLQIFLMNRHSNQHAVNTTTD